MKDADVPDASPATLPATGSRAQPGPDRLRIVAIASSAGGLEALRELLETLPPNSSLSCVVAQHGLPAQDSALVDLLSHGTRLRVRPLEHGQAPEAGTLYVVPPNRDAVFADGRFGLAEPLNPLGPKPSANHLFQSMARALGENAVGVVLSGTGSDGAAGLRDIKAAGGLTLVQDPRSAKHDGMPTAAIRAGGADLVLRPREMGPALLRLLDPEAGGAGIDAGNDDHELHAQVAHLVRVRTAFRLDEYKPGTVQRRIARRQGLLNLNSLSAYLEHLRGSPDEAQQLVRDIFISVTSFFRDADAYRALERAIGALVRESRAGVMRCWVPGCASGEEAYSIAMLFEEALRVEQRADLQYLIFASDLDDNALETARSAACPPHAQQELPAPLRERYLETQGGTTRVLKSIRNRIVFARQNVIDDPPFSRMDLISCRNLLIYLSTPVQRRVLELFHYALRPGGLLFLGRSESADTHADLFVPVDARARLYVRREGGAPYTQMRSQFEARISPVPRVDSAPSGGADAEPVSRLVQEQLVQRFAPPSLVIDEAGRIEHLQGALKPFLDLPDGRAEMNLFEMVDPAIRAELRAQAYRTRRDRVASQGAAHRREIDGVPHQVLVRVEPLERGKEGLMLVSFVARPAASPEAPDTGANAADAAVIAELEQELATARSHLNVVVEQLASSNEELQSLAKELQSANEELQSGNEELQTSNEELQSTNEELQTSNEELQVKSTELEAAAALLTNVKQSLDFPLLVVDEHRCILDANSACADLVYHDGPLQGLSLNAVPWRFPIAELDRELREVLVSGNRRVWQLPGDAGRQYQLHLMPFRPLPTRIAGVVMLFENMTAVNQAQAARRESDSRYQQVTESLPQLVWTCLADGPCDYLSPQWVQYTGVPEAQQLGFGWLEQLHPDDRQRAIDHWTRTSHQGLDYEIEFRIRRHDGVYRWFHTLARPVRDAEGAIVKWFGSNTDIDDRKRAEDQIQELNATLEERVASRTAELVRTGEALRDIVHRQHEHQTTLRRILTAAPMAVRISRMSDHRVVFLNKAYAELVRRSPKDAMNLDVRQFYDPAAFADIARRLGEGETVRNELVELCRPEEPDDKVWALASFMVIDYEGERSVLAWLFDVTVLQVAKRAAEEANQTKSRFLANMSHEIRTPMNGVIGMIDMARRGLDDPLRRDRLDKASQSAHRLLAILNDILDLSKIEAGHMRLHLAPTDLRACLENTRLLYEHAAQQKGLQLVVELDPAVSGRVVLADALRLGQVLDNLVNNAIKFSSGGTVRLRALPEPGVPPPGHGSLPLRFEVIDRGQGIAAQDLNRVFNVFEQADSSSTRTHGGTGLGLAICRRLVTMMGGEMGVTSALGEGSTFWFSVPFEETATAPAQAPAADVDHAAVLRARFGQARILVAEDEPTNQELEAGLLEELGLRVELVPDGLQAVAAAARERFDLILMDMQMPHMNGLDATRAIRRGGPNQHTPIVALTANVFDEDRQRCLEAGMTDFITKPMSVEALPERLVAWLGARR